MSWFEKLGLWAGAICVGTGLAVLASWAIIGSTGPKKPTPAPKDGVAYLCTMIDGKLACVPYEQYIRWAAAQDKGGEL